MLGEYNFQDVSRYTIPPTEREAAIVYDFLSGDITGAAASRALGISIFPVVQRVMRYWYQKGILVFKEDITDLNQLTERKDNASDASNN